MNGSWWYVVKFLFKHRKSITKVVAYLPPNETTSTPNHIMWIDRKEYEA